VAVPAVFDRFVGTFLYESTIVCDIRIIQRDHGATEEDMQYDQGGEKQGEYYFIQFGSPLEREKYISGSLAIKSLDEAVEEANKATNNTITWHDL
jgi:hypothetical protein